MSQKNEQTSARVAAIAGRVLAANLEDEDSGAFWNHYRVGHKRVIYFTGADLKALAASALTQAADKPKKVKKKIAKKGVKASVKAVR